MDQATITMEPLVSVVCLSYNHQRFVREAVESVLGQTYGNIQLILVDDASTDASQRVISDLIVEYPDIEHVLLSENVGNTKAFNMGLSLCRGDFIIDLAADDVMMPDRIEKGVTQLIQAGNEYGVNFTNAELIDEAGRHLRYFYPVDATLTALKPPKDGDVYADLIGRYFINSITMLSRREVFDALNGYDETLAYEDFDFWIRSARKFKYLYTDKPLVKYRQVSHSMSSRQYAFRSRQMESTYRVCMKIQELNEHAHEKKALQRRIYYEMKQAVRYGNVKLFVQYLTLLRSL